MEASNFSDLQFRVVITRIPKSMKKHIEIIKKDQKSRMPYLKSKIYTGRNK